MDIPKGLVAGALALSLVIKAHADCTPVKYDLSAATVKDLKDFRDLFDRLSEVQNAGQFVLSVAAFQKLMDDSEDAKFLLEIRDESWGVFHSAFAAFSQARRSVLHDEAQRLALKYQNSGGDYRFWRAMAKNFSPYAKPTNGCVEKPRAPASPYSGESGGTETTSARGPGLPSHFNGTLDGENSISTGEDLPTRMDCTYETIGSKIPSCTIRLTP